MAHLIDPRELFPIRLDAIWRIPLLIITRIAASMEDPEAVIEALQTRLDALERDWTQC